MSMTSRPFWVSRPSGPPDEAVTEHALATIKAALPPSLLVLFALHLDAMKKERAIGHLGAEFHMHRGDVRSAAFSRKTSWQRSEPVETQRPIPEPKP
jgi:hypothetical protein